MITFYYDYLEAKGIAFEEIERGLPYPPEHLRDKLQWIDQQTLIEIEQRIEKLFPDDEEVFYRIGRTFMANKGVGFMRFVGRFIPSLQFYSYAPRMVKKFLFPLIDIDIHEVTATRLRASYRAVEGFRLTRAFLETGRGIYAGIPLISGEPSAKVTVQKFSDSEAAFEIELQKRRLGLLVKVKRFFKNLPNFFWTRRKYLIEVAAELESTNILLQDKVDALTDAYADLDNKVRDLSMLNKLAQTSTEDFDLNALLSNVVKLIHRELNDLPTILFIAEGEPEGLVVGASSGVLTEQADLFQPFANASTPLVQEIRGSIENSSFQFFAGSAEWTILPMKCRQKLVGALALGTGQTDSNRYLFESMTSQLAVAIDNAISYQVIKDLRDNLELKVKERTAELEVATDKLEDTVIRLEKADRAKADFFTNVSHEFRTPLTLLMAPLEELLKKLTQLGLTEELDNVTHMRRNANHLLQLVNEILDFAKLDQGQMQITPKSLNLIDIIENLLVTLEPLAMRNGIELNFSPVVDQCLLSADSKLFRRALINLIVNAIKYCDADDTVTIALSHSESSVEIRIEDDGPGIPLAQQQKIFERFERATDTKGRVIEGSGIGLAMVKEIVELHNGMISLESEEGVGSTFKVTLPRKIAEQRTEEQPQVEASLPSQEAIDYIKREMPELDDTPELRSSDDSQDNGSLPRLLLVEDNREMQTYLASLLRRQYNVLIASDGLEGLELVGRQLPDIVLSDVSMPRMTGFQMCQKIKTTPKTQNIPVILLTAKHTPEAAVEGFSAGADDFVVKPFSPQELLARIEGQVRIRALTLSLIRAEKQVAIGTMSAGIAHEVLNPVNAVINSVRPLKEILGRLAENHSDDPTFEACHALLDVIEESGNKIHEIVNAILTFTRPKDGDLVLKESRVSQGIESALSILNFSKKRKATIHKQYDSDDSILCYPELLNQVVMNLVVNAIDALPDQGGNVWINTSKLDGSFYIRVKDDGPGIPREDQEKIFTPFFTTKPPDSGTGLGLAISREIISLHQGNISVSSTEQAGAEFVVALPVLSEEEVEESNRSSG